MKNETKRIIIEWTPYGATESRYSAATLSGVSGDRVFLSTIFGDQAFSRRDGRWIEGPCLNFEHGRIHQFDNVEASIQAGRWNEEYEATIIPSALPA